MWFFFWGEAVFFWVEVSVILLPQRMSKKNDACQVHQCLHGQIRLQQSDPLQAYTHCATKSLASDTVWCLWENDSSKIKVTNSYHTRKHPRREKFNFLVQIYCWQGSSVSFLRHFLRIFWGRHLQ